MARVKTLVESLREGYETAFDNLDRRVENLGNVRIEGIKDSVMPAELNLSQEGFSYLERVVIYNETNKLEAVKGKAWQPSIDMDLLDFLRHSNIYGGTELMLRDAYRSHGKKTIRDIIAMPEVWFIASGIIRNYKGEENSWNVLKRKLNKYGSVSDRVGNSSSSPHFKYLPQPQHLVMKGGAGRCVSLPATK